MLGRKRVYRLVLSSLLLVLRGGFLFCLGGLWFWLRVHIGPECRCFS